MVETIWLVSAGEYDYYRVMTACPSKEDAERLVERYNAARDPKQDDEAFVESVPVFDGDAEQVSYLQMWAVVNSDGSLLGKRTERVEIKWSWDAFETCAWQLLSRGSGQVGVNVYGTDHERVRKAFDERLAELRAGDTRFVDQGETEEQE